MATAAEHYKNLLADHYSWMCGGFDAKVRSNLEFFTTQGITPRGSGGAVDLGAGPGFQSIPLAQLGFKVLAVDLSRKLLDELESNRQGFPITLIHDDLLNFPAHCEGPAEVCVCMGDTLPHLETFDQVRLLLERVYRSLECGGRFILTFRDLTCELTGLDRFIPVRSDADTIFTCFLEYETTHVRVHDLVYSRSGDRWVLCKSWYRKLRISAERAVEWLKEAGFTIDLCDNINGLITIIAGKPAG
ncbi:MAG: class I SAM-dependent methyltransferase [Geobacter sp.]|nr:class I SAM-dependent methyltransferase [Geobacter sp.]